MSHNHGVFSLPLWVGLDELNELHGCKQDLSISLGEDGGMQVIDQAKEFLVLQIDGRVPGFVTIVPPCDFHVLPPEMSVRQDSGPGWRSFQ
jgi:hypothetical protein